jgi:hypothetical protein
MLTCEIISKLENDVQQYALKASETLDGLRATVADMDTGHRRMEQHIREDADTNEEPLFLTWSATDFGISHVSVILLSPSLPLILLLILHTPADNAMRKALEYYRAELAHKENVAVQLVRTSDRTLLHRLLSAWQMQPCLNHVQIKAFGNAVAAELECKLAKRKKRTKKKKVATPSLKEHETHTGGNGNNAEWVGGHAGNESGDSTPASPTSEPPPTVASSSSQKKKKRKKKKQSTSSIPEEIPP